MEKTETKLIHRKLASFNKFKLIIPVNVERKIRFLCNEIHDVEWSGVLFYSTEGSFDNMDLVIKCVDIFQMDEGTKGYTEFKTDADIVNYMCNHVELLQETIYHGLIHSHNNMSAFFSGTDLNTLTEEGSSMPHFVSLIVNNEGNYVASVTRYVKSKSLIEEQLKYTSWQNKEHNSLRHDVIEEEYVEYYDLEVIREGIDSEVEKEMKARVHEIRELKSKQPSNPYFYASPYTGYDDKAFKPKLLFDETVDSGINANTGTSTPNQFVVDDTTINNMVWQSITCNPFITADKVNKDKWVKSMSALYKQRFGTIDNFKQFAYDFVSFLIEMDDKIQYSSSKDMMENMSTVATEVSTILEGLPQNDWIKAWVSIYNEYIL